jgi:hypothetical protein
MSLSPSQIAANVVSPWWDKVDCEVKFDENGIHLEPKMETKAPELEWLLVEASRRAANQPELAKLITEASKKAAAVTKAPSVAIVGEGPRDGILGEVDTNLARYVFRGHRIPISQRRVTEFSFFTNQPNWTFEAPGFWADPGHEFVGTFDDPQVIEQGKKVRVRFYPNGPASWFKYNLKMSTTAWQGGVDQGHVIIIIDPVMETGGVHQ